VSSIDAVKAFLDDHDVAYEVIEHEETLTAADEGRATNHPPEQVAKVVVLRDRDGYRLAVLPAAQRLDLHKVRDALDATGSLQLATEEDMRADFPQFEAGATPPLGPMLPAPELFDRRLLDHDRVLCSAGDHRHSLLVDPTLLARAANAEVTDICAD
jgi:Ala-tRNA(Pro) deacylase